MAHAERRDIEATRAKLRDWFARTLRDARDVEVDGLRSPSETGFSSDTLLFDLRWEDAQGVHGESLVVRLEPTGFPIFPRYDIPLQFRLLQLLGSTDIPVPRVRWLEEDRSVLGVPFYIMERVHGRIPTDIPPYHTGGWISELTPAERERLWWSGLEAMARVHRLDWERVGVGFLDEPHRGATPLEQHLRYYDEFLSWGMGGKRYPLIERAREWLEAHRPPEEPLALCWGDSRIANQVFDEQLRCIAVLDWEMARLGDPVQDLGWWVGLDRCFSEGIGVPRLPGFPDRQATIARWEELVGRPAHYFGYYEIFALYRFAIIMARVGLQMKHYKILPPDHDMDENNLAAVTLGRALEEVA